MQVTKVKRPVRICMAMLATNGGSSVAAQTLGEDLIKAQPGDFEVRYCHLRDEQKQPTHMVLDGARSTRQCELLDVDPGFGGAMCSVSQLLEFYQKWPFDVLHIHNLQVFGCTALMLKQIHQIPFVVTFHGSDVLNPELFDDNREVITHLLHEAAHITCVSEYLASTLSDKVNGLNNISVISNFMQAKWRERDFDCHPVAKRVLHVSSMRDVKRPKLMFEAFARLQLKHPDARLVIVTTTEGERRGRQLIEDGYHSGEGIDIIDGDKQRSALMDEYARAELFILTSRFEGFGLVVLEALAHQLPVIVPKVGGLPEVVTSDWPYLIEEAEHSTLVERYAHALDKAIASNLSLSDKMQEILDCFDGVRQVEQYARLYRQLVTH